jgi:hypothetical protein
MMAGEVTELLLCDPCAHYLVLTLHIHHACVAPCRMQQVCLNYHFAVEQRARSFLRTFFGFNGTAGVWRRTAMEQAGGWNMESTVEDMDLSLRAYLNGWKFK